MLDNEWWSNITADFGDYELGPAIGHLCCNHLERDANGFSGFGAASTVYSAVFKSPKPTPDRKRIECAIKVSSLHPDVDQLFKETRILGLSRHPNVLR